MSDKVSRDIGTKVQDRWRSIREVMVRGRMKRRGRQIIRVVGVRKEDEVSDAG